MPSPRRSLRARAPVRSYKEVFEDNSEDDVYIPSPPRRKRARPVVDAPVPGSPNRKKARPVVIDSGDETEDDGTLTNAATAARESPFANAATAARESGHASRREASVELNFPLLSPTGETDEEIDDEILAAFADEVDSDEDFNLEEEEVLEDPEGDFDLDEEDVTDDSLSCQEEALKDDCLPRHYSFHRMSELPRH